jgi:hypothetical protein
MVIFPCCLFAKVDAIELPMQLQSLLISVPVAALFPARWGT